MNNTWQNFRLTHLALAGVVLIGFSGCSVVMAVKQPPYKNLNVLKEGTARAHVISELGVPLATEQRDGKKVDLLVFKQGYGKGNKIGRAVFHGVADLFTLCLWEVIGTPMEMVANGRDMKAEVIYDSRDRVAGVIYLDGRK